MLGRVYMHATRVGTARDYAHLSKRSHGGGFATSEVA